MPANSTNRVYLSPPHIGEMEHHYVAEAFASNWIAPLGPNVDAFEEELAQYVGAAGAVALSSGTAAIHLSLLLAGVQAGDVVFCSSLTFVASANPILLMGATPVFIDSEPQTWNMSPSALRRALLDAEAKGKLPKAVIVVNLYGQSADMAPIREACDAYGIPVIEDAAESLGATYGNKRSGTLGKFGIYSFNGNKIITTSGGGMLVSDDVAAIEKARFLATQARDRARHYQHSQMGFNYRMSNLLAGIGRGQLGLLEERVAMRRHVFMRYQEALRDLAGITFMPEAAYGRSTRWLTAFTIDAARTGFTQTELLDQLEAHNIEGRPVWKPLHLQPLFYGYAYYSHEPGHSVSDRLFDQGVCVPSGSNLSVADQDRVIDCILSLASLGIAKH